MTVPVLQASELCRSHGQRTLWQIPQLNVPAVGNLLLQGANGVGKTLLLKSLAGLEVLDCQNLLVQGVTVAGPLRQSRLRAATVYVHSQPWLFHRTVEANVACGLCYQGLRASHLAERVWEALEWAGLQDQATRQARQLSTGQQRLLAITRAWVLQPALLLLDEPLTGLDQAGRQRLLELLGRLTAEQRTVLWTSHEVVADAGQVDELWRLEDGQLSREVRAGPEAAAVLSFRPPRRSD